MASSPRIQKNHHGATENTGLHGEKRGETKPQRAQRRRKDRKDNAHHFALLLCALCVNPS
jgi:hypothetical protein